MIVGIPSTVTVRRVEIATGVRAPWRDGGTFGVKCRGFCAFGHLNIAATNRPGLRRHIISGLIRAC